MKNNFQAREKLNLRSNYSKLKSVPNYPISRYYENYLDFRTSLSKFEMKLKNIYQQNAIKISNS
jgi:hypothetical protein